ncbi:MAG TPA: diguanylate cyclase, partial [Rectinemataceae bacterium]|nr:diguanylate cyclase [Rectinemataceae bacterium]
FLFVGLFNALSLFTLCAFVVTSQRLLGGASRARQFFLGGLVVMAILLAMAVAAPERWIRVVLVSLAIAAICGYAAVSVLVNARRARIQNGPGILALAYGMGCLFFLARAVFNALPGGTAILGLDGMAADALTDLVIIVLFSSFDVSLLVILMVRVEREVTDKISELAESRNNLQILYDVFAETAGSIDLEELVPRLLDLLHVKLGVDASAFFLLDQRGDELSLVAQRGLNQEGIAALLHRQKGTTVIDLAFGEGRSVMKPLLEYPEGELKEALRSLDLAIFAAFPIAARGEMLGSLGVSFKDAAALDGAKTALFETMARQLGAVVRAATLHAELERANARLDILASTDSLTHLANRRTALRVLEREIARAKRMRSKVAVVMCDLDHFKLFNDRYGHECGDFVLAQTATIIAESLRATDLAARWGGEEFLIILGSSDPEGCVGLAGRIRRNVESASWEYSGEQLSVTITLGVAICPPEVGSDAAIAKADQALYEGKRQGRNRVGFNSCSDIPAVVFDQKGSQGRPEEEPLDLLPADDED